MWNVTIGIIQDFLIIVPNPKTLAKNKRRDRIYMIS